MLCRLFTNAQPKAAGFMEGPVQPDPASATTNPSIATVIILLTKDHRLLINNIDFHYKDFWKMALQPSDVGKSKGKNKKDGEAWCWVGTFKFFGSLLSLKSKVDFSSKKSNSHSIHNQSSNLSNTLWETLPNLKILGKKNHHVRNHNFYIIHKPNMCSIHTSSHKPTRDWKNPAKSSVKEIWEKFLCVYFIIAINGEG